MYPKLKSVLDYHVTTTHAFFSFSKFFFVNSNIIFSKIVQESFKWRHYFILKFSPLPEGFSSFFWIDNNTYVCIDHFVSL